jgi:hypothetical protein
VLCAFSKESDHGHTVEKEAGGDNEASVVFGRCYLGGEERGTQLCGSGAGFGGTPGCLGGASKQHGEKRVMSGSDMVGIEAVIEQRDAHSPRAACLGGPTCMGKTRWAGDITPALARAG